MTEQLHTTQAVVDEDTGLPADYASFFEAYRPLMLATAIRAKIPLQDAEDAVHEVQIKFWQKNGLDMYDPSKGTKFATLLRNWAGLFLLQERDKVIRNGGKYYQFDGDSSRDVTEHEDLDAMHSVFAQQWVQDAEQALAAQNKPNLIPVLKLCVDAAENNTAPSRAQIAEAAGCKLAKATPILKELRAELTKAGMGIESLYE